MPVTSGTADGVAEAALFQRLRARDMAALDRACERYGDRLRRIAWLMLGDHATAEDVAQEAMIIAWDRARKADENTRLGVWLIGIAVNLCRVEQRKKARRRRRETVAATMRESEVGHPAEQHDEARRIREAVRKLGPELREVVALRYLQQMSVTETATALGIPEGTVKSRTHAAMAELRRMLPDLAFE